MWDYSLRRCPLLRESRHGIKSRKLWVTSHNCNQEEETSVDAQLVFFLGHPGLKSIQGGTSPTQLT